MAEQKPHKHRDLIIAWANGALIQYRNAGMVGWENSIDTPQWFEDIEYRIKPKKWEPESGNYTITSSGVAENYKSSITDRNFGIERKTKELAERSFKELRSYARLLAYRDEFCPGYDPDFTIVNAKFYVYQDRRSGNWGVGSIEFILSKNVLFPKEIAKELADKLNKGEVEL